MRDVEPLAVSAISGGTAGDQAGRLEQVMQVSGASGARIPLQQGHASKLNAVVPPLGGPAAPVKLAREGTLLCNAHQK